jgi:hypothetical protein
MDPLVFVAILFVTGRNAKTAAGEYEQKAGVARLVGAFSGTFTTFE